MKFFGPPEFNLISRFSSCIPQNFSEVVADKNSIFHIHVPKTGGTYLNHFFKKLDLDFFEPGHLKCSDRFELYPDPTDSIPREGLYQNKAGYHESLKICVIRNPFDWLTSYYFHSNSFANLPINQKGVGGIRSCYPTFDSFIEAYCDKDKFWPRGLSSFRDFYPFQIFDNSGNCQADFIIKNSTNNELMLSLTALGLFFGIDLEELHKTHVEIMSENLVNKSQEKTKDYKEYYKPKQIDSLNEKWQNILGALDYNFDGSTSNMIMLDGKNLKYNFENNSMKKVSP
jgi:hypothetical protein